MGRRTHDGRRRAAKVEARRKRRTRPPRTRATRATQGAVPTLTPTPTPAGAPPAAPFTDEDEVISWADDPDDDRDRLVETLWLLRKRARIAVADTLASGTTMPGRLLAAEVEAKDDEAGGERAFRALLSLSLTGWLLRAREAHPDGRLAQEAVAWVARRLGPSDDGVRRVAEVWLSGPLTSDSAVEDLEAELGGELTAITVWLAAAVVAVAGRGDPYWLDLLDFGTEEDVARVHLLHDGVSPARPRP